MKSQRTSGASGSSSGNLRRKDQRAFWSAIVVGVLLSAILAALFYLVNKRGH